MGTSAPTLRAPFIADERKAFLGLLTGARCELPTGEVVEVLEHKQPFYNLCRKLDRLGYGDHRIEISTPTGTPSTRAVVSVAAGLMVVESNRDGLRLEPYRPFPHHLKPQERDEAAGPTRARVPTAATSRCAATAS